MEHYNKEVCEEKHKTIEERFKEGADNMDKMDKKINWLLGIAATTLVTFASVCFSGLLHLMK
jgi:hypothetical protein